MLLGPRLCQWWRRRRGKVLGLLLLDRSGLRWRRRRRWRHELIAKVLLRRMLMRKVSGSLLLLMDILLLLPVVLNVGVSIVHAGLPERVVAHERERLLHVAVELEWRRLPPVAATDATSEARGAEILLLLLLLLLWREEPWTRATLVGVTGRRRGANPGDECHQH
jgi:hypothetical protein